MVQFYMPQRRPTALSRMFLRVTPRRRRGRERMVGGTMEKEGHGKQVH